MDAERQIRFLYPPFFLLASLAYGWHLDGKSIDDFFYKTGSTEESAQTTGGNGFIPLLVAGSVFVIVTGYFIGTVSMLSRWFLINVFALLVRGLRRARNKPLPWKWSEAFEKSSWVRDEAVLSDIALSGIERHLCLPRELDRSYALYAAASFDHGHLAKGIHDWLTRRWNAYNISVNSIAALVMALFAGWCSDDIDVTCRWVVVSAITGAPLLFSGVMAWKDTMAMIEFQSQRL